jgi:hypothetical protein
MPEINCRYMEDPFDRDRMREAIRKSFDFMEHEAFRDIVDEVITPTREQIASDDALDAWIMASVDIGQHLSGTCKMGSASDPTAVVDQYGRVYGTENLRVADASIMPDVIRANTNLTTIMIGERIADWIKHETTSAAPRSAREPSHSERNVQAHQADTPSSVSSGDLLRSLDELSEAVAAASESEIPVPDTDIVQEAARLIRALHSQAPREYMVYLMPNGSIAIDTRGARPDGAFITLSADGSAFCSSRSKGGPWRQRYEASGILPDETLLDRLRSLEPAGA